MDRLKVPDPTTRPLVVFGTGPVARIAHFLFTHDSRRQVAAFAADASHITEDRLLDIPVVAFEEVTRLYPPAEFDMFVAVGYRRMNAFRAERYQLAKDMGYALPTYVSTRASVWPDLDIGDNCLVMDQVVIHPYARIGADTILWSGSHVGHDAVVGDHCFIASHAVVSGYVTIEPRCFLGSNATIRDGVTVARECVVGAGAVIVRDTKPGEVHAPSQSRLLPISSDRLPNL
jgi:sugar O-acyltransferase (sialic acid O-acetyltransferase NeuD family)